MNRSHALIVAVLGLLLFVILTPTLLLSSPTKASALGGLSNKVPAQYREAIIKAAAECEMLTPGRLAAQIEQESGWDPNAVSPAGAQGLAQFMPDTWKASGVDGDGDGKADPMNPLDAIASMAKYMCSLSGTIQSWLSAGQVSGDPYELTLAAYNAGVGAVQQYRGIPPFSETQNYLKHINELVKQYTAITEFKGTFRPPIDSPLQVASPFGLRIHPIFGTVTTHDGVDLASPMGETQVATAAGTVTHASWLGGCGNTVIINHGTIDNDRYETWHCHLSAFVVKEGQTVKVGDPIGLTGSTGNSTGPHVHYQINRNDQPVDPMPYLDQ